MLSAYQRLEDWVVRERGHRAQRAVRSEWIPCNVMLRAQARPVCYVCGEVTDLKGAYLRSDGLFLIGKCCRTAVEG